MILVEEMTGEADDLKRRRKIGQMIATTWKDRVIAGLRFVDAGMVHGGIKQWRIES